LSRGLDRQCAITAVLQHFPPRCAFTAGWQPSSDRLVVAANVLDLPVAIDAAVRPW
jgi:hypothetical protein